MDNKNKVSYFFRFHPRISDVEINMMYISGEGNKKPKMGM